MGIFTTARDYRAIDNPYTSQIAQQQYNFGPARKFYKGQIKDPLSQPGVGQFATDEASAYEQIRRRPHLQSGYSAAEADQYELEKARRGIGGQRMAYVGAMQQDAARNLMEMFDRRNRFNLDKYSQAAGQRNADFRDYTPTASPFTQLLGAGIAGAAQVGSAFATGGASAAAPRH